MNQVTNQYEYRVFGLRRGGNHALIAWIASAMPDDSVYFFNDVCYDYDQLFSTVLTSASDNRAGTIASKLRKYPQAGENKHCIIQSYEDQYLNIINEVNKQFHGNTKHTFNVVILRDINNTVASRLELYRKGNPFVEVTPEVIQLWKDYAKEFIGETHILSTAVPEKNITTVFVNYNKWHSNEDYRNQIASKLMIDPSLADINARMLYGGGSSFSNTQQFNYNERWLKYQNDPEFNKLTNNDELKKLNDDIINTFTS